MPRDQRRLNVTLDDEHAHKLSELAARVHVQDGTLARSLLSNAIDQADPSATVITEVLSAIPGALDSARTGVEQARRGDVVALEDL